MDRLTNLKEAVLKPDWTPSLCAEDSPWHPNSQLATRSIKRSATTLEGTIVAIFTDRAGDCRYAVELFGHRTIQIASEGSLIAHVNSAV